MTPSKTPEPCHGDAMDAARFGMNEKKIMFFKVLEMENCRSWDDVGRGADVTGPQEDFEGRKSFSLFS
ncbi:MAG: hypothetical protein HQL76_02965 [Magnetococcales bacterium]|nr:hypothetical protein [Magnetococcales bacterium]